MQAARRATASMRKDVPHCTMSSCPARHRTFPVLREPAHLPRPVCSATIIQEVGRTPAPPYFGALQLSILPNSTCPYLSRSSDGLISPSFLHCRLSGHQLNLHWLLRWRCVRENGKPFVLASWHRHPSAQAGRAAKPRSPTACALTGLAQPQLDTRLHAPPGPLLTSTYLHSGSGRQQE